MRRVPRTLLLAAILLVAGCNLFRSSDVQVAKITSIAAPDTVHVGTKFDVTVQAFFACDWSWVFDHVETIYADTRLDIRFWSHRWEGGAAVPQRVSECEMTLEARPLELGEYRIIAHQPDGSTTLKTITVLP